MEFQPFWELLDQLGIKLPNADRLKARQAEAEAQPEPPQSRRSRSAPDKDRAKDARFRRARSSRDPDAELGQLIELMGALGILSLETVESDLPDPWRPAAPQAHWVPFGETAQVGTYKIPGLVYVGDSLSSLRHHGMEPSLIRPMLPISRRQPNYTKPPASYNPSYTQMRESERAAYLSWLAGGRCDSQAHSSYVWLFFYGLERRVLHDLMPLLRQSPDPEIEAELKQIIVEVKRLKNLYGSPTANWSFDNKLTAFLEVCRILLSPTNEPLPTDFSKASLFELQVGLGRLVAEKQPLPPEWALVWYNRVTNNQLPTVAVRCPDEFNALFALRYRQKHGAGIVLKPGKSRLSLSYFPSSPSFGRLIEVPVGDLPDLSRLTAKVRVVSDLVYACRMELEPLSRLLGRNPEAKGKPAALALLPPDLLETHGGETYRAFLTWLKQLKIDQPVVVKGETLLHQWAGSNPDKFTPTEAQHFSKLLAHLGYGLEPDPRFGAPALTAKSTVALFKLPPNAGPDADPDDELPDESPDYRDAALLTQLTLATASGDQPPSPAELIALETQLAQIPELSPAERARLAAQIQVQLQTSPSLRSLKAKIERLDPKQLPQFGQVLIRVAAADGPVTPQEVKLLEKAYALLSLDLQTLYSDIHDLTTSEPVTVCPARPRKGHKIPTRPPANLNQADLDMTLVQSKLAESAEISSLLADIFTEESPAIQPPARSKALTPAQPSAKSAKPEAPTVDKLQSPKSKSSRARKTSPPPTSPSSPSPIPGLDAPHSALLRLLAQKPAWPRAELQAAATSLDLMLDGALEVINELAFERIDEPVTEGEDPIEVNQTVMQELL